MLWYIITIALGIVLDLSKSRDTKKFQQFRKLYIFWLYIFLCFGYMNGSDWRDYEPLYYSIRGEIKNITSDYGFFYLWYAISYIFHDYWVMAAFLKILYLTSVIKLTQKITPYWLGTIGFLMPISLIFMLIQNPLRFMVALTIVNISFIQFLDKKYLFFALIGIAAIFFHATTVFFLVGIPLLLFSERIAKTNRVILASLYLVVLYLSSNVELLNRIFYSAVGTMLSVIEGMKDYTSSYLIDDNTSFFSLGSIINIMLFGVVLLLRDDVVNGYENGRFIYGSTVLYCFLQRFCLMIPTGFRLVIPLGIFYAAYIVYALKFKKKLAYIFVMYFALSYPRKMWNSYDLIPYTNSIYYIVTEHKPYMERVNYHYIEYQKRTGHSHLDRENQKK